MSAAVVFAEWQLALSYWKINFFLLYLSAFLWSSCVLVCLSAVKVTFTITGKQSIASKSYPRPYKQPFLLFLIVDHARIEEKICNILSVQITFCKSVLFLKISSAQLASSFLWHLCYNSTKKELLAKKLMDFL